MSAIRNVAQYLSTEGIGGAKSLSAVAEFLEEGRVGHVYEVAVVARHLELSEQDVRLILDRFEERGVLRSQVMARCPECDVLAPWEDLRQAREAGDDYPCAGQCDEDLAQIVDLEQVTTFELLGTPAH